MWRNLFDSPAHLVILVLVIVIVFGWKRLPDAARSLGRSARILKSEVGEMGKDKDGAGSQTVKGETSQQNGTQAGTTTTGGVPGEAPAPNQQASNQQAANQQAQAQQPPQYQPPQNGQGN
ncbi:Sec-independent protein translocase subunit TatA [Dermacoccaceae bacterium W4C1]